MTVWKGTITLPDDSIPYQCFISYSRVDNDTFDGIVDRLRTELAGRFEAATGNSLEIFLDRDAIGWGEDWRDKIFTAISGTTLFIPIITMRYFNSQMCREEFSAFHAAATQSGAEDLILPIVLSGEDRLSDENPDDLVRAVAARNWVPISNAWESGYDSADWKRALGTLVSGLRAGLRDRIADRS